METPPLSHGNLHETEIRDSRRDALTAAADRVLLAAKDRLHGRRSD